MPPWISLLLACAPAPEEPTTPPPAETGCTPTPWFTDADGDGHGDPETAVDACEGPAGLVAAGDDCDDADPELHPGATEKCNLLDDDCDGELADIERDDDGDGFSDCAGDCDDATDLVAPGAEERCDELDNDCDGLLDLDDDTVDVYSCGWCPETRAADNLDATYQTRTLNPCVLDPTISLCSIDPRYPDTHTDGNRLHRFIWRTDLDPLRDELLMHIPPGPGEQNNRLLSWAAHTGFRVLSVGWQNDPLVDQCTSDACFETMRREMLYGEDANPDIDIWPSDSLMGRLDTLFAYLVATYPQEGWDRYWDAQNGMHWDKVIVMGWSVGSGEAAYLGTHHPVHGQVLISGPLDLTDGSTSAAWMSEPREAELCRQWAAYHRLEPGAGVWPPSSDLFPGAMGSLGIPGPAVDVDSTPPPYGNARLLNTEKTEYVDAECNPHHAMAMDGCMHADLEDMYKYIFCSAGNLQGPCE